jgi:hypothetical protein
MYFFNSTANHAARDSPGEAAGFWKDEPETAALSFDEGAVPPAISSDTGQAINFPRRRS